MARTIFTGGSSTWAQPQASYELVDDPPPAPIIVTSFKPDPPPQPEPDPEPAPPPAPLSPGQSRAWYANLGRGKTEIFTETMRITPALAKLMLEHNPGNRKLSRIETERVERALREGTYEHNGETIKVATDGTLNDGQNRLTACVRAGIGFTSEVTFGLSRESRMTVDIGVMRSVGHLLQMDGRPATAITTHAAQLIMTHARNGRFYASSSTKRRFNANEVRNWVVEHDDFYDEDILAGRRVYHTLKVSSGLMAALHYLFRQRDPMATQTFFRRLVEGHWAGMSERDPVFRLREFIHSQGPFSGGARHEELGAVAIKAFNLMRSRQAATVQRLRWMKDGPNAEGFPEIE